MNDRDKYKGTELNGNVAPVILVTTMNILVAHPFPHYSETAESTETEYIDLIRREMKYIWYIEQYIE